MNFMEAAQAMKEGRIVIVEDYLLWKFDKNLNCFCNRRKNIDTEWSVSSFTSLRFIGANWEVAEDDWNLAYIQIGTDEDENPVYFRDVAGGSEGIKKCRDLILKDLRTSNICISNTKLSEVFSIVNKRFGAIDSDQVKRGDLE